MSLSNFSELAILNAVGGVAPFSVAACYVKLHIGNPGEDGLNSPAAETTRKQVTFSAAAAGQIASNIDLEWLGVAAAEDYTHASLWDDLTAGNCIAYGTVTADPVESAGDNFRILAGDLVFTLD